MVLKRKRISRGNTKRKRMNISAPRRKPRAVMLSMKRTRYDGNWTFSTATTGGFWRYQSINSGNINDFAGLAALFDEYKVHAVKQTFRPRYDSINQGGVSQAYAHVIIDPESTIAPSGTYTLANVNAFLENGNVKTYTLNKPFSVYYRPKQLLSTPTGSVAAASRYNKTTDTTCQFPGFHMMIQQNNMGIDNTSVTLDSFTTVYFSVRNLK